MAFQRAFIDLSLSVDLDGVPGNFNKPEDFVVLIKHLLQNSIHHYKPEIRTTSTSIVDYHYDDEKKEMVLDTKRLPKKGDKAYSLSDGEGTILSVLEYSVIVYFGNDDEVASVEVPGGELTWIKNENRWQYGDMECK